MATQFNWVVNQLDTIPSIDGLTDVVSVIHWSRIATQNEIVVSSYGTMNCTTPSETDFTAYPDLTYEQVCGWLENGLDTETIDLNLDKQIENIINPPIINLPLPWANLTI
jgi:hypothetical protein